MIAIRFLELTKPVEVPTGLEDKEAVRFYCSIQGQFIGHVTIWNRKRPIGRSMLIQEICNQLGQTLLKPLMGVRFGGEIDAWWNIERLIRTELGLEPVQFEPTIAEAEKVSELPNLKVSICIPTRDRPEDLTRCLQSLINHKSRVPFEIIVADNNPASGKTEPIVRNFPRAFYVPEPRPGVSYARNAAALHASGDIIVTTDDDVIIMEDWLDNLIAPYSEPEVMAVTGMILPFELEYISQYWFEIYGGLTNNYQRTRFDRNFFENTAPLRQVPAWKIGTTANASFRAKIFADPAVGPFDDVLRVSEDLYMFYRLIKNNRVIIYEPKAVVQHRHRTTMAALDRQIYSYGRSSVAMQLRTYFRDGDERGLKSLPDLIKFDRDRMREIRQGKRNFPLHLVQAEAKGHWAGPLNLLKQTIQVRTKLGHYTPKQFALAQAARHTQKLELEDQLEQLTTVRQLAEPGEARQLKSAETVNPTQVGDGN